MSFSTSYLLRSAGLALLRWSGVGFSTVSNSTLQRRLNACSACPNLTEPPKQQRTLYRLTGAASHKKTVCGLCGCTVSRKARIPTEACPDTHPQAPDLTRWQETKKTKAVPAPE